MKTTDPRCGKVSRANTRLEDCGVHHAYPELHHCSECERAYCGRAGKADLTKPEKATKA